MRHAALLLVAFLLIASLNSPVHADGKYKNFRVAIYVTRNTVNSWSNPDTLAAAWEEMTHQVSFDKVYLEIGSGRQNVDEKIIDPIKKFFTDRGIIVSCGTALNGGGGPRGATGGSLSFSDPQDRAYVKSVAELAARHFDEIILDDWYFTASKTPGEIAAKGDKSWTQFRLAEMDEAAQSLLINPAKAINPKFRLIIKYPNWYEHFQGLGYDLDAEPKIFDAIYTGVETRDPIFSEQHLQQYLSFNMVRYLENIKPGGNDGGWVDQLGTRYIDRYAEQIWDLAFAKPREITLWQWGGALGRINVGTRPWENADTSLNFQKVLDSYHAPAGSDHEAATGRVAGYALEQVDSFLGKLGNPIGIPAYRPPHAIGEEFLHDYLGMIGIPIDLHATFPTEGNTCLLTEGAKNDPDLVSKIKTQLVAGKNVVITSGLLHALSGKGIEDISEFEYTDQKVGVTEFQGRRGLAIPQAAPLDDPIFFPVIHFLTNQSWSQVSGADSKSPQNFYPIVLSDVYSRGSLFVLAIPDNPADLYRLPPQVLNAIKNQILGTFPIRLLDAPGQVALFPYDNNTFVVESYLPTEVTVSVLISSRPGKITDLLSGQTISPAPPATAPAFPGFGNAPATQPGGRRGTAPAFGTGFGRGNFGPPGTSFSITIPPHSYRAFDASEK